MKKRPILTDVAKLAGVSTATVSAIVNNRDGHNIRVNPETRERVLAAIAELGYVANPAARILAKGKNKLIGIFTYEPIFPFKHHDFYYPFLLGIEEEAEAQGYNLLIFTNVTNPDGKRSIFHEGASQLSMADGSILLGLNEDKDELRRLYREGHSFVYVGRREVPETIISYTAADYIDATRQLTDRLFDLGHKALVYICLPRWIESNEDRESGFCLSLKNHGIPVTKDTIIRIDPEKITKELVQTLINRGITGAVVENDALASALLNELINQGYSVPEDFSITLCGNPQHILENSPDWTMFTIPRREMGIHAVRLLVRQLQNISGVEPETVNLPCTIVSGNTIAPPSSVFKGGNSLRDP
jgi:DNA-binding LacI/PurR family transcriptional regulator